jgi:hypothetical protein
MATPKKSEQRRACHASKTNRNGSGSVSLGAISLAFLATVFVWSLNGCGEKQTEGRKTGHAGNAGVDETAMREEPRVALTLARGGRSDYAVVLAKDATELETKAAADLTEYLKKVTGAELPQVKEGEMLPKAHGIYVGQTLFALQSGLDFREFTDEEYAIKTIGENLVITGNRPNGSWNAVCHFLQRQLGCRFFSWDCEVVPRRETLPLTGIDVRRMPSFAGRLISIHPWDFGYTPETNKKANAFMFRNFSNHYRSRFDRGITRNSENSTALRCHNSFFWVDPRVYAKDHPEYFSRKYSPEELARMKDKDQSGQVCWTNHDVWEITLNKLREVIKSDRAELKNGEWPTVYQLSQNDVPDYCQCPKCAAVTKAEGSFAGPQLMYVNYVAENIAKEYPDVKIMAFAYVGTEDAPKTIRPAKNVIIQWCDLYTRSDCYRPLTSKFNAAQKARLDQWVRIGVELAVWDYWNMGIAEGPYFNPPRVETIIDAIAPDLRYFRESGVTGAYAEAEFCQKHPQNFIDLQYYLGFQMMADVTQDEEKIIAEYMAGYYGSAAPAMTEFLMLLRQAVKAEKEPLFYIYNPNRSYTDGAFLEKCYRLLKKALVAAPADSDYARRVQQEMIAPLAVIIMNPQYDFFQRTGLKKEAIVAEYKQAQLSRIDQPWISDQRRQDDIAALETEIAGMNLVFPTPDFLQNRGKTIKFAWPQMQGYQNVQIEPDADSIMGKALVARAKEGKEKEMHDMEKPFAGGHRPNEFGVYNTGDKRWSQTLKTEIPQDEKYHWYKIQAFELGSSSFLWGFYWNMSVKFNSVYANADGMPGYNIWETWISVKYAGPAYAKGSTQKNGVFLDQVILVKPETAKP